LHVPARRRSHSEREAKEEELSRKSWAGRAEQKELGGKS